MYVYELSKQNLELSSKELLSLSNSKTNKFTLLSNYLLIDELVNYKHLAYTKKVYKLLIETNEDNLISDIKGFDFEGVYETSFSLNLVNSKKLDVRVLADNIWQKLSNPKVDLKNAKTKFEIIFLDGVVLVCKFEGEQNDKFEDRRAHLREFNHPTSMHPRLARAIVNLVDARQILDPFCGSGGILLEAGLIGKEMIGYDLDKIMLRRCQKNLDFFKLKAQLELKDALTIDAMYEAIVTDIPYGRNSKTSEITSLLSDFLVIAYKRTNKMVLVVPDMIDENIIKNSRWNIKQEFSHYLHKSLTRKIYLLGK